MTPTTAPDVSADERIVSATSDLNYAQPKGDRPSYLAEPGLAVTMKRSGGRWLVYERHTEVFGQGATPWDATRDFRRAITDHIAVLEGQDRLSPRLAAQLEYLRRHA